jgi:hypothetical protein
VKANSDLYLLAVLAGLSGLLFLIFAIDDQRPKSRQQSPIHQEQRDWSKCSGGVLIGCIRGAAE